MLDAIADQATQPLAVIEPRHRTRPSVVAAEERAQRLFEALARTAPSERRRSSIRADLIEMHLPLAWFAARRFASRGELLDDLVQVATLGLIKSVDRFDPSRGVPFACYAIPNMIGEIKRHFRDRCWAVRVPRQMQELRLEINAATAELGQRLGRAPTVAELAAELKLPEDEVIEGLQAADAYSTVALDAVDPHTGTSAADGRLGQLDDALAGVEYRQALEPLLAALPDRERKIVLLRFYGNMTQSQIAAEIGISQMHVSRLLRQTLTTLRVGLQGEC